MGNFKEDIARVRAFVFDVDGVFTDGRITVTPERQCIRTYHAKDGFALKLMRAKGYPVCVITAGAGESIVHRFRMFGIEEVTTDCYDKLPRLHAFMQKHGLGREEVLYMGDDIPDIPVMRAVGVPVCPTDAASDVKRAARYVSEYGGGRGCVRDVVEQVLRARGDWFTEADFDSGRCF